jgi:hypothetical protein
VLETDHFCLQDSLCFRTRCRPKTVDARSEPWIVFARSNALEALISMCVYSVLVLSSFVGSGLASGWSPVQGVVPTESDQDKPKGWGAIAEWSDWSRASNSFIQFHCCYLVSFVTPFSQGCDGLCRARACGTYRSQGTWQIYPWVGSRGVLLFPFSRLISGLPVALTVQSAGQFNLMSSCLCGIHLLISWLSKVYERHGLEPGSGDRSQSDTGAGFLRALPFPLPALNQLL